jgi:heat shock protein HtpX
LNPFQVTKLSLKVWLCLGLIALAHLFIGYHLGSRLGLFIGFMLAVCMTLLVFNFGIPDLLRKFQAQKLEGQDAWGILDIVSQFADRLEMQPPSVFLIPSSTPLAFSLGRPGKTAALALSEGLLRKLSNSEIQAVIAHQISHIRTIDTFRVGVSSSLASAAIGLSQVLDQGLPTNWLNKKFQQKPFESILSPIAALLIRFAISNKDYFANDDLAASLIENKKDLASALWKMQSYAQTEPTKIIPCTSHLFIVNPEGLKESNWFFVTHPSLESRIRRLVGTYPL